MIALKKNRGVSKIAFHLEVLPAPSYFSFYSYRADLNSNHTFLYEVDNEKIKMKRYRDEADLAQALQ